MQQDAVTTAEAVVRLMEADRFAEIDELRVPALRDQVSADALREPWQELITTYGSITQVGTRMSRADALDAGVERSQLDARIKGATWYLEQRMNVRKVHPLHHGE